MTDLEWEGKRRRTHKKNTRVTGKYKTAFLHLHFPHRLLLFHSMSVSTSTASRESGILWYSYGKRAWCGILTSPAGRAGAGTFLPRWWLRPSSPWHAIVLLTLADRLVQDIQHAGNSTTIGFSLEPEVQDKAAIGRCIIHSEPRLSSLRGMIDAPFGLMFNVCPNALRNGKPGRLRTEGSC